jgi:hypothetical protein
MPIERQRRLLIRHAFLFLFLAILLGIATAVLPHARAWLGAHVSTFLIGLILAAIGLAWREPRLSSRQRTVTFVATFLSAYLGLALNLFAALRDLPGPASSPGVAMPMPDAVIFFPLLAVLILSTLVMFGMLTYGMRGEPPESAVGR